MEGIHAEASSMVVAERLVKPHAIIVAWLADHEERKRRARQERDPWQKKLYDPGDFSDSDRRQHRFLDALFKTIERQGGKIKQGDRRELLAEVSSEKVEFLLQLIVGCNSKVEAALLMMSKVGLSETLMWRARADKPDGFISSPKRTLILRGFLAPDEQSTRRLASVRWPTRDLSDREAGEHHGKSCNSHGIQRTNRRAKEGEMIDRTGRHCDSSTPKSGQS